MKKLIGLIPLYDDDKDSYWMLPGYMKVLEACGALPVMLPLTTDPEELNDCFSLCDGILMTGGHDVDPALYAETAKKTCGIPCSSPVIRWKRICLRKRYRKTSRYLESAEAYSL